MIQPILEQNCASCHSSGGPGADRLNLDTAAGAQQDAKFIGFAVEAGVMPPWPAGGESPKFQHDRRLSADEIAAIAEWAKAGGALDVDPSTKLTPTPRDDESIEHDVTVKGLPYKGSTVDQDDYHCQVYDPKLAKASFLQGIDFSADQVRIVHHALVFTVPAAARAEADALDAKSPAPGFDCPGLPTLGGVDPVQIMSWGPGQAPLKFPADAGVPMKPGDFFIMQIHYHYSAETDALAADESSIALDFASDEVIRAAGGTLDPITLSIYLAPAEIPCRTDQKGPLCDRAAAIADLATRSNPLSGFVADQLLQACGKKVEDFAGMTTGVATTSCEYPVQASGEVLRVWGHMHELGATFKMTINPGRPDEKVLLDIPDWQFEWQLDYAPADKTVLRPGDVVRVECSWDRSRRAFGNDPRYIVWSEGTQDEMCWSQITTR